MGNLKTRLSLTSISLYCLLMLFTAKAVAISVRDDSGHVLHFTKPIRRIICLAPNLTAMVLAAGAGRGLLAVDKASYLPPALADLPRISSYPLLNVEAIYALKPDLVLAWQGGNPPLALMRLRQLGVPVYDSRPERLKHIARTIRQIGELYGSVAIAKVRAEQFLKQLNSLKGQYQHKNPVRVFLYLNQSPLLTISHLSYLHRLIRLCGGRNVFAHAYGVVPTVSIEQVIKAKPQVIIALTSQITREVRAWWRRWQAIPAVQQQKIYAINQQAISQPGPNLLLATSKLCQQIDHVRHE